MLCRNPYMNGLIPCPCGQCMPCRINRRRLWTHRLLLEQFKHEESSFVTLTYNEESLPANGTLVPRHLQLWLKRLRKLLAPLKIRYYAVGEYGDISQRPHYHIALFGASESASDLIQQCWPYGYTYTGDLTPHSAQYIAGYVTKKMTSKTDTRLNGRYPEFARMSLRPGIGADAMEDIANSMITSDGQILALDDNGDVPLSLRHGGKLMPLGRYLRRKLREQLGQEANASPESIQKYKAEMRAMLPPDVLGKSYAKDVLKGILLGQSEQKVRSMEARAKIYQPKKTI